MTCQILNFKIPSITNSTSHLFYVKILKNYYIKSNLISVHFLSIKLHKYDKRGRKPIYNNRQKQHIQKKIMIYFLHIDSADTIQRKRKDYIILELCIGNDRILY